VRLSSRNAWRDFFRKRSPKAEEEYPFYQVIDKLEREAPEASEAKLAALGFSLEEVRQFINAGEPVAELEAVVKNLRARGLGDYARVDYHVIRGLAYYTGVVFEVYDKKGDFRAIAGGGRYDNLIKLISGGKADLPALGFGMGDVVLLEMLGERGLVPALETQIEGYCLIEEEALREVSLDLVQHLREEGFAVDYPLGPAKADKQFKRAMELKADFTFKLEPSPQGGYDIKVKNLATREEKTISGAT